MIKNPKNAFWEAFFLAMVVFIFGMLLGVAFESSKVSEINKYYMQSEISLIDIVAMNNLVYLENMICSYLINANLNFADKIYEEAYLLEKYESAGKVTEEMRIIHKKYDLLRTFLWINSMKTFEKCKTDFSIVVYLYDYETEDLTKRAVQNVWSKILFDLKQQEGSKIILIPIAMNKEIISLNSLASKFGSSDLPVVIINDKIIIRELNSVEELKKYLN